LLKGLAEYKRDVVFGATRVAWATFQR
jgi:hypothetical protein